LNRWIILPISFESLSVIIRVIDSSAQPLTKSTHYKVEETPNILDLVLTSKQLM